MKQKQIEINNKRQKEVKISKDKPKPKPLKKASPEDDEDTEISGDYQSLFTVFSDFMGKLWEQPQKKQKPTKQVIKQR